MPGENVTLSWESVNATEVRIHGIGPVDFNGSRTLSPTETTTYVIEAEGPEGIETSSKTVEVVRLHITIDLPYDGVTIHKPFINVKGTFISFEGMETGIIVNGVTALVYEDNFVQIMFLWKRVIMRLL